MHSTVVFRVSHVGMSHYTAQFAMIAGQLQLDPKSPDAAVVTVAIDTFASTFDSSVATIGWVSVGYLLAAAVSLPVSGWAVERFGGRRVFLAGIAVFVVGSALSSLAWSAGSLIAFRVVQGFGGGALEPTALTLAARTADGRRVGTVMGLLSLVVNLAPVLGPLLGGLLVEGGHWRWIFLINVPLGLIVATLALLVVVNDPGDPGAVGSDLRGLGLLSPGFAAVLLAIERLGAEAAAWSILLPAAVGVLLLGWYVGRSLRVIRPVIDLRMFAGAGFASSVGVMALVGFLMYSQLVALPLYARDVHHLSGIASGVLVTALGAGLLVSMALAARRSDVVGPRRLAGPGAVVTALGLAVFTALHDTASIGVLAATFVVVGLGFGAVAAPTFSSVYRTVPPERAGQATTTMFIVVQTSASFGVTVIGLLLGRLGVGAYGPLAVILTASSILIALLSRLLPGPPSRAELVPGRQPSPRFPQLGAGRLHHGHGIEQQPGELGEPGVGEPRRRTLDRHRRPRRSRAVAQRRGHRAHAAVTLAVVERPAPGSGALEVGEQRIARGQRGGRERPEVGQGGDLGGWIGREREQRLAHAGGVDGHERARRLVEPQRMRRVDVQDDEHLVPDAGAEADRLARLGRQLLEAGEQVVERHPGLGAPTQRDQRRPEVVALGAGILGNETVMAERLQQAVGGAHAEPGPGGHVGHAEVDVGGGHRAQHAERPLH